MQINDNYNNLIPPVHNIEPVKRNAWRGNRNPLLSNPLIDEAIKLAACSGNRKLFKDKQEEEPRISDPREYPPLTLN